MADAKGRSHHAVHYVASPDFMKAVRVCDSGIENFDRLCGEEGFELTLRPAAEASCMSGKEHCEG